MNIDNFELNTGRRLPLVGFGTWQIGPDATAARVVAKALKIGYRIIDTAKIYGNERGIGQAIRESGIPREEIFVTNKVWNDDHGYDRTLKAFEATLDRLGLDYLDLYLIHWPATSRRQDSWRALERLYHEGRIKAAGVSNYTVEHLQNLIDHSDMPPAVNQFEFHPFIYRQQAELLQFCKEQKILVEAYSPISRISNEQHAPIRHIAERLNRSPQQIILRWCVEHGTLPLARSENPGHMADNLAVNSFALSPDDMKTMDALSDGHRVTWDPASMG